MKHAGFTLIELMVVTAIVGILTAIAIPEFGAYRKRAYDVQALSDLRSVAIAEEAYYLQHEEYESCSNGDCEALPGIGRISEGVRISIRSAGQEFTGTASHEKGTGRSFQWDSMRGGLQE
jgi:prepilin-type N-terminal cleavage/methylation domain-containing protein